MGSGPTPQQTQAQTNLGSLAGTGQSEMAKGITAMNNARARVSPFYQTRMNTGLPFFPAMTDFSSGTSAQAFAPARASLLRATSRYGTNMPSGYRDSMLTNLEAARGRAFDQSLTGNLMMNEQAKQGGAQGLMNTAMSTNPMAWANFGAGTNQSIMQADNMRKPNVWGTVGGLVGQGLQTAGQLGSAAMMA
jgi:hypothetical protein